MQGEKGTWASLLHAAIDVAAADKRLKLAQRAGKRDAPTYVELLHVLVSVLANTTAEVREMAPLAPRLLAALRMQTPGYVESRAPSAVSGFPRRSGKRRAARMADAIPRARVGGGGSNGPPSRTHLRTHSVPACAIRSACGGGFCALREYATQLPLRHDESQALFHPEMQLKRQTSETQSRFVCSGRPASPLYATDE